MSSDPVLYETDDGICTITLNRPRQRNALDGAAMRALSECWRRFKDDREAAVAIITGAGDRAFCAGLDLGGEVDAGDPDDPANAFMSWGQVEEFGMFPRQLFLGKPTIAALNGPALGIGGVLALQCDLKVAVEQATLGYTLAKLGLFPPYCHELWDLGPPALALESLLTGDPVKAADAYRVGLVNAVVPIQELVPRARSIAARIRDNAPWAVKAIKMVWDTQQRNLNLWSLHVFHDYARRVDRSDDAQEGPKAFAEKRKPKFRGR
jgi:enoyl-CoA hydratase/carnithine racemase